MRADDEGIPDGTAPIRSPATSEQIPGTEKSRSFSDPVAFLACSVAKVGATTC